VGVWGAGSLKGCARIFRTHMKEKVQGKEERRGKRKLDTQQKKTFEPLIEKTAGLRKKNKK